VVERRVAGDTLDGDALSVASGRAQLAQQWKEYVALPAFPGERALWPPTEADMVRLSALIDASLQAHNLHSSGRALDAAKAATDRLDDAVRRLQDFNLAEDARLATQIGVTWRRSVIASVVGISLVMIIAFLTAWALVRLVRDSARALEDRASECEAFAGLIAHDLANPIAAARMTLALAHETVAPSAPLEPLLDRMAVTLLRASTLLQDLYRYTQAGVAAADMESCADVSEVLQGVVDQVRPSATRQHIELSVEASLPVAVACRPGVLISIMTNLVENALKHMGQSAQRRVAVHVRVAPSRVRIEVEDFGPGIEPAIIGHIFDPFVRGTTLASGLGLGLATVKRLTEGHGGSVGVRSSVGKGSVFWCELPKAAGAPDSAQAAR
jgi:signal transduction histidine kinase